MNFLNSNVEMKLLSMKLHIWCLVRYTVHVFAQKTNEIQHNERAVGLVAAAIRVEILR